MPITNGIYWQQQSGGLCRMHSLNAYFGKEMISLHDFNKFQMAYDAEYRSKFNLTADTSCKNFDIVMSDQNNIITYILKHYKVYTRYYALNQLALSSIDQPILQDLVGDFFFIYDENHIYGARRTNTIWHSVNSIGGVSVLNINSIFKSKNLGFIIPVDIQREFYRNLKIIKTILPNFDADDIKSYLIKQHQEKTVLGELEIPLGICMDIMETNLTGKDNTFAPIANIIKTYNAFLREFTNGRYNDIDLIINYLPEILSQLIKL